jgi:hypothetical protein
MGILPEQFMEALGRSLANKLQPQAPIAVQPPAPRPAPVAVPSVPSAVPIGLHTYAPPPQLGGPQPVMPAGAIGMATEPVAAPAPAPVAVASAPAPAPVAVAQTPPQPMVPQGQGGPPAAQAQLPWGLAHMLARLAQRPEFAQMVQDHAQNLARFGLTPEQVLAPGFDPLALAERAPWGRLMGMGFHKDPKMPNEAVVPGAPMGIAVGEPNPGAQPQRPAVMPTRTPIGMA